MIKSISEEVVVKIVEKHFFGLLKEACDRFEYMGTSRYSGANLCQSHIGYDEECQSGKRLFLKLVKEWFELVPWDMVLKHI